MQKLGWAKSGGPSLPRGFLKVKKALFQLPAEERTLEVALANTRLWTKSSKGKHLKVGEISDLQDCLQSYFKLEDPREQEVEAIRCMIEADLPGEGSLLSTLRSRLDRLDIEPGPGRQFSMVMYKRGGALTPEYLDDVWQHLSLCALLLARGKYKAEVVKSKVLYLSDEPKILCQHDFTPEDLRAAIELVQVTRDEILEAAETSEGFGAQESDFCFKGCSFRSKCPIFVPQAEKPPTPEVYIDR